MITIETRNSNLSNSLVDNEVETEENSIGRGLPYTGVTIFDEMNHTLTSTTVSSSDSSPGYVYTLVDDVENLQLDIASIENDMEESNKMILKALRKANDEIELLKNQVKILMEA